MQYRDKSYRKNFHRILKDYIPEDVIKYNNIRHTWKKGYNEEYDMVVISHDGCISDVIEINGLKIALPNKPKNIRFYNLKHEDQKWRRYSVPDELQYFDKIYADETNIESLISQIHKNHLEFIKNDFKRINQGDWLYIDGEPIYISGGYYFFLQHYFLTDMRRYGDFRMPQRDYFLWLEACYCDDRCIGSLLLKQRRMSFSTTAGSEVLRTSIRTYNGFFPIVSKKDDDAQLLFDRHIVKPLLKLPKHLQPQRTGEVIPKKELHFSSPKRKLTNNSKVSAGNEGLDTTITPLATTLDTYDGTQPTISVNDEIGKLKGNLDINQYWDQAHKMCHIVGDTVRGKAICGSTANPPNKGGKNYQIFFEASNVENRDKTGRTFTGLYALFIPSDFTTMGFFDEWGHTIYYNPKEPIRNELGNLKSIGSKEFLDDQELSCNGDIRKLNSQKRNNPRVDTDPFLDEEASSLYGTTGVINHINFLKEYERTDKYKERVRSFDLFWKDGITDGEVGIKFTDNGKFACSWLPPKDTRNKYVMRENKKHPVNENLGAFGCDPYQSSRVSKNSKGSKLALVGFTKENPYDLADFEQNKMFLLYNHRPSTIEEAEEDIIKAVVFFSMPILPERNKDSLIKTMIRRGYRGYILLDPTKEKRDLSDDDIRFGGINNTGKSVPIIQEVMNTYVQTQISETVDENNIKVPFRDALEDWNLYSNENKSQHDITVATQLAIIANKKKVIKKEVKTYEKTEVDITNLLNAY